MSHAAITLVILVGALGLFVTEIIPLAITPLAVLSSLTLTGVLTAKEAVAGFSNDTTLLLLFMCPIGEALFRTGVCTRIGRFIIERAGKNELTLIGLVMAAAACLSAFTSNTGTAIVMIPIVLSMARQARINPSRLLLPLAYGASFGGMLTLIGTPPNVVVQGAYREVTGNSFGFFDFAKVSFPVVLLSILYMVFVGRRQIAAQPAVEYGPEKDSVQDFRRSKMGLAVAIVILVVVAMLFEGPLSKFGITLSIIAMMGSVLTVVTGCINMDEFFGSIEWTAVFLVGGMQPLSSAMQKTGAADTLAGFLARAVVNPSPFVLTAMVILVSGCLAQFISHTAATSILVPVCIAIAHQLNVNPAPILMALCQATSIAVATPIGTPPNIIVYRRGGYKFKDFLITGLPLFIMGGIVLSFLIPKVFPY